MIFTEFQLGFWKKAFMFEVADHGLVIENEGKVVCVYGTDRKHETIFCAIPLCHPKYIRKHSIKIYQEQNRILVDLGVCKVVIDYGNQKCSCDLAKINVYGSDAWGKDVFVPWTSEFEKII